MLAASMSSGFARPLTVACAIGAGLVAGVFFAFSTFVMRGLRDVPPATGMAAPRRRGATRRPVQRRTWWIGTSVRSGRTGSGEALLRPGVADITFISTAAGFLYLAVVLDAWSRKIVGSGDDRQAVAPRP